MSNSSPIDSPRVVATTVSDENRETFLPNLFGSRHFFAAEHSLYNFMSWLSPRDYTGGFWDFLEFEGRPLYMSPPARETYAIQCDGNGYSGSVSTDAAGIIVTLFTLSHLSFRFEDVDLADAYNRLYAYAAEHPEAGSIFAAID